MFVNILRKITEVQFFALVALLVAVESLLVFAGVLPPMVESNIGHSILFFLRMAVFLGFAWTLVGKPILHTLMKGGIIALVGAVTQIIFIFIGKTMGLVLLGIATPSDLILYIVLLLSTIVSVLFGAVIVSTAAWIFAQMIPTSVKKSAETTTKIKRRKR